MAPAPLGKYCEQYQRWICSNPEYAQSLESTCKFVSFLIGVQSKSKSAVYSELMYCSSNLLTFFHDQIIRNSTKLLPGDGQSRLKIWLTVLEYCEAFVEVLSTSLWGERGKWVAVLVIQLIKAIGRLTLLIYYKCGLLTRPPVSPMGKSRATSAMLSQQNRLGNGHVQPQIIPPPSSEPIFTLKRSGKVVRKTVSGVVQNGGHPGKPLSLKALKEQKIILEMRETLNGKEFASELLHVLRPLVHLTCAAAFGSASWKPWLACLGMDMAAAQIRSQVNPLRWSPSQSKEVHERAMAMVFYLLRSPFYDRYAKDRLTNVLLTLSSRLPLVGLVLRPLATGIPEWQKIYAYMWSN